MTCNDVKTYNDLCDLTFRKDFPALHRAKRLRAIELDRALTMTAEMRRKLVAASDRLLEALAGYEDYIVKAIKSYDAYRLPPESIEFGFRIEGDKNHRHLHYPEWYYDRTQMRSRKKREQIKALEAEMAAEPNWVDVNDMLYNEDYRADEDDWLHFTWHRTDRTDQMLARRRKRMAELAEKDADGICRAFYRLKDIYHLALEDMIDITKYHADLHARIPNF